LNHYENNRYSSRFFKCREAIIHFELYRIFRNILNTFRERSSIKYLGVEPEYTLEDEYIKHKMSIDLAILAKIHGKETPFLAIEVKDKTVYGVNPFKQRFIKKLEKYAKILKPVYYALTDGYTINLFSREAAINRLLGIYRIELSEECIQELLEQLEDLYLKRRDYLDFEPSSYPYDKIKKAEFLTEASKLRKKIKCNMKKAIEILKKCPYSIF